jgi:hypothetical protein
MTAPKAETGMKSWLVQCTADSFEHAAYLAAVFSEVLSVNEQGFSLQIASLSDRLKGQLDKIGVNVSSQQCCAA